MEENRIRRDEARAAERTAKAAIRQICAELAAGGYAELETVAGDLERLQLLPGGLYELGENGIRRLR
jgi:hypothetical protein